MLLLLSTALYLHPLDDSGIPAAYRLRAYRSVNRLPTYLSQVYRQSKQVWWCMPINPITVSNTYKISLTVSEMG